MSLRRTDLLSSGLRRVVVTGLGAVTAAGWGVGPFRESVLSARTVIGAFDRLDHTRQRTHLAAQVPDQGPPARRRNQLSLSDRFALFAACEAVEQAGLTERFEDAGVYFGSSTGGLRETERYVEHLILDAGKRPPLSLLASYSHDSPAETVAKHFRICGPVETISSACASGGMALEQGMRAVRQADVDIAIVGGADCLSLTTYSGFNALRSLDEHPCRPFRADRQGLSLGEGGAVLVLEALDHAIARGVCPLAEILGAGSSCDASHMTAPHPDGVGAALAIDSALADAGIGPGRIDFINAHGTGTPLNDAAEFAALRRVFGDRASCIPLEATKGVVGHLLGTAGIIEAVSTVLALAEARIPPASGGGEIDPAIPVNLCLTAVRQLPAFAHALSVSLGFGGANTAIVFGAWRDDDGP